MKKTSLSSLLVVGLILVASFTFAGCTDSSSKFTMTDDASKVQELNENQIMYQTSSNAEQVLAFYREKMTEKGLKERELLTVLNEGTLNLVFDGSENGQALVIQATALDEKTTNVIVRFEGI